MGFTEHKLNKNIILLLLGYMVSSLGDSIYLLSITFYVLEKFRDPLILGVIMTSAALPQLIFGFFAGQIIDRINKKRIIIIADIFRAFLMFMLFILVFNDRASPNLLILITFSISTIGVFFNPTIVAIVPLLTREENLKKVNSVLYGVINISIVLGPILGGVMHTYLGFGMIAIINGISYILSASSELFIDYKAGESQLTTNKVNLTKEITSGINIIFNSKILKNLILLTLITNFFFIPFFELMFPYLIKNELNENASFYGKMLTMRAIGTILGSYLVYILSEPKNLFSAYIKSISFQGFTLVSVGVTVLLLRSTVMISTVLYLALFIAGFVSAMSNIPFNVMIQKNAPLDKVGTVSSTVLSLFRLLAPISLFIYGLLMKKFSVSNLSIFNGTMVIVLSIGFLTIIKKKSIKEMNCRNEIYD